MSAAQKQLVGGIIFLALSVFYGWEAGNISLFFTREGQVFTARTVPYALSLLGVAFSLYMIVVASVRLVRQNAAAAEKQTSTDPTARTLYWRPVVLLIALMAVYAALFSVLGFIVATTGFLIGAFAVLGARGWRSLLVVPIGTVLVFWLLVGVVMNIHLVQGTIWNIFR